MKQAKEKAVEHLKGSSLLLDREINEYTQFDFKLCIEAIDIALKTQKEKYGEEKQELIDEITIKNIEINDLQQENAKLKKEIDELKKKLIYTEEALNNINENYKKLKRKEMKKIIHKRIYSHTGLIRNHFTRYSRYLCNQAVYPRDSKLSHRWDKVNCKNCLKQKLKKKE